MNRKQNVGEAFSGVGRLRKKGRVFFHGLLQQNRNRPECSGRFLGAVDGLRCSNGVYPMTRNFSALVPQRGHASTPSRDLNVSPQTRHIQYCLGRELVSPLSRAFRATE